jgi:arsenate reductase (thioredoxin)
LNILYICTHNRCRSAICESITNKLSGGRVQAYSAGSQPAGEIHPLTLKFLEKRGFPTADLKSESWDKYFDKGIDVAITVCDSAASEACPLWMGDTSKLHWGLKDPSKVEGTEIEVEAAFMQLIDRVSLRVERLLEIDLENISPEEFCAALIRIAEDD